MSSIMLEAIKNLGKNKHTVGSLNNWRKDVVNLGAIVEGASIDNYCLVELGFNSKGERTCKALTDQTKKGYLIASVEDYLKEFETMSAFYNGVGDRARVVVQTPSHRFECSNFEKADKAKEIKNGQKAHYDITKKKFVISNGESDHSDLAAAGNVYYVVDCVGNTLDGQHVVRFEII